MELPDGWRVWSDEPGKVVLAYRPDVFDGGAFPSPCLPTIYLTRGRRGRRPGGERTDTDQWFTTLFLEPDVRDEQSGRASREAALTQARDLAARFASGAYDYRSQYQVLDDREPYLDRLDELTGRDDGETGPES